MSMSHENGGWMNDDQRSATKSDAEKRSKCEHMNFACECDVNRLLPKEGEPINRYQMDVRVKCAECGLPFRFIGLPAGLDLNGASVSVDACEGRFAIAPKGQVVSVMEDAPTGFSIRTEQTRRTFPAIVAGRDPWPSIQAAVPQTFGEAIAMWGPDVIKCEPHEWDNRTTEENAIWLLCRLHVRKLLSQMKKWKRSDAKQYMLMETIGDGPKINDCDSWLCPYKDFASFLHDTLDGMEDPATIATIRFTFMEMDDVEFEEYCVENGVEWEE